jgi:hypothetical protein
MSDKAEMAMFRRAVPGSSPLERALFGVDATPEPEAKPLGINPCPAGQITASRRRISISSPLNPSKPCNTSLVC